MHYWLLENWRHSPAAHITRDHYVQLPVNIQLCLLHRAVAYIPRYKECLERIQKLLQKVTVLWWNLIRLTLAVPDILSFILIISSHWFHICNLIKSIMRSIKENRFPSFNRKII